MKKYFGFMTAIFIVIAVSVFLFLEGSKSEYVCVKPPGYLGIILLEKDGEIGKGLTISATKVEDDCKVDVLKAINIHADDVADLLGQGVTVKGICVAMGTPVVTLMPPPSSPDAK